MDRVNLLATTAICVCFANLAFVGAAKGSCIGYYAPLVSGSYAGQTAEIATLTNYSALCPSSPTTTLCVAGIARAMADAQSYFVNESSTGSGACPHHNMALVLQFPAGTYDISGDHAPVILDDNQNPVVLSLPNNPGPISATERLILAGGGGGGTTLLSDYHWKTIYGTDVLSPRVYSAGVSHVTVSGFTFARNAAPVSQGVLTNVTLNTSDPSNITGSIAIQIQNSLVRMVRRVPPSRLMDNRIRTIRILIPSASTRRRSNFREMTGNICGFMTMRPPVEEVFAPPPIHALHCLMLA
jgi:hypothetical protein